MSNLRFLGAVIALAIALAALAPTASAATTESCPIIGTSACGVVTNRVMAFGTHGGVIGTTSIQRTGAKEIGGWNFTGSSTAAFGWNASVWDGFRMGSSTFPEGEITYGPVSGPLKDRVATVRMTWGDLKGDTQPAYRLSCPRSTFLVCSTPLVNGDGWTYQNPQELIGLATIESRPLILKIANQTDQPLARSSEPRESALIRDTAVADPATIPALTDGLDGGGYYHYFRDTSKANNATMAYTFADGTGATSLTGGVITIDINVAADGSTSASSCKAPEGLAQTVQCKVTMLGTADGILTALVTVGV